MNSLLFRHYFPLKELLYTSVTIWVLFTVVGIVVCIVIIIAVKRKLKRTENKIQDEKNEDIHY